MKKEIEFRDPVVRRVVDKFVSRSDVGFAKYGVTLEQDPSEYVSMAKSFARRAYGCCIVFTKS